MPSSKVIGVSNLASKFYARIRKVAAEQQQGRTEAIAGYAAPHALEVHNKNADHVVGQMYFLGQPARQDAVEIVQPIAREFKHRKLIGRGVIDSARNLIRLSKPLVPVDTGALKASGFAAFKRDYETVFATKRATAITKRETVLQQRKLRATRKANKLARLSLAKQPRGPKETIKDSLKNKRK